MRTLFIYFVAVSAASVWGLLDSQNAHAQLSQVLRDYKHDRPFVYSPDDPWTRSNLFREHTKHAGFAYNCDGEECKRRSPHIRWQAHTENDLPARAGWCTRIKQTVGEVKQRIADGSCQQCDQCQQHDPHVPAQRCQTCHGGTQLQPSPVDQVQPPGAVADELEFEAAPTMGNVTSSRRPVRTAGLESLDTRLKNR